MHFLIATCAYGWGKSECVIIIDDISSLQKFSLRIILNQQFLKIVVFIPLIGADVAIAQFCILFRRHFSSLLFQKTSITNYWVILYWQPGRNGDILALPLSQVLTYFQKLYWIGWMRRCPDRSSRVLARTVLWNIDRKNLGRLLLRI